MNPLLSSISSSSSSSSSSSNNNNNEIYSCNPDDYLLIERIGRGAFSSVWSSKIKNNNDNNNTNDDKKVAIKIMDLESVSANFEDILQEVRVMRLSDDPNILRCHCCFVQQYQLWLVTQLMDKGSCLRVLGLCKNIGLGNGMTEECFSYILRETLQGLAYLHSNGHIHRDIKSGNILLDSEGRVRLADFGVSGWTVARGQRQDTVTTFVGTPCYMAPEVMEQAKGYDNKADIWSLGITALEMAKGTAPYAKFPPMRVLILTIEGEPPSLNSYDDKKQCNGMPFSSAFEEFCSKCLQKNPSKRPSAEELLKCKFLKNRPKDPLVRDILSKIKCVGKNDDQEAIDRNPGEEYIRIEKKINDIDNQKINDNDDKSQYTPGISWVFDFDEEGSKVIHCNGGGSIIRISPLKFGETSSSSSLTSKVAEEKTLDEFLADFEVEEASIKTSDNTHQIHGENNTINNSNMKNNNNFDNNNNNNNNSNNNSSNSNNNSSNNNSNNNNSNTNHENTISTFMDEFEDLISS